MSSFRGSFWKSSIPKVRKSKKYKNQKVENPEGRSFDSKLESSVHQVLQLRIKAGEIKAVQHQDQVYLTEAHILYKPDFKCERPDGSFFWVEAKGVETAVWRIKRRLWEYYGPGILEVWKGSHVQPKLFEVIRPKERKK